MRFELGVEISSPAFISYFFQQTKTSNVTKIITKITFLLFKSKRASVA